jgi:hypothetical protein
MGVSAAREQQACENHRQTDGDERQPAEQRPIAWLCGISGEDEKVIEIGRGVRKRYKTGYGDRFNRHVDAVDAVQMIAPRAETLR